MPRTAEAASRFLVDRPNPVHASLGAGRLVADILGFSEKVAVCGQVGRLLLEFERPGGFGAFELLQVGEAGTVGRDHSRPGLEGKNKGAYHQQRAASQQTQKQSLLPGFAHDRTGQRKEEQQEARQAESQENVGCHGHGRQAAGTAGLRSFSP